MSDEPPVDLRAVADYFGLPGAEPVAKDLAVVRAIRALIAIDATPFTLVFGGGTALARAHKVVRRMSEDVDFKIVPTPAAPVSRSGLRRQRSMLRDRVTAALQAAGFAFDPENAISSQDENGYTIFQLPYTADGAGEGLRPTIQIELKHTSLRLLRRHAASIVLCRGSSEPRAGSARHRVRKRHRNRRRKAGLPHASHRDGSRRPEPRFRSGVGSPHL